MTRQGRFVARPPLESVKGLPIMLRHQQLLDLATDLSCGVIWVGIDMKADKRTEWTLVDWLRTANVKASRSVKDGQALLGITIEAGGVQ